MSFKAAKYVLGLLLAFQLGSTCFAQDSIFAKFDNLSCREAEDKEFPNYSKIFSVSMGGAISTVGKAGGFEFSAIKLVKTLDDCTPELYEALSKGTVFKQVTIKMLSPATGSAAAALLLEIDLQNVLISSDEFAEAVGGQPSEVVTVTFTKITITHVPSGKTFEWSAPGPAA